MELNKDYIEQFYENWMYLNTLEAVHYKGKSYFKECLNVTVVKVSKETQILDVINPENNDEVQFWIEFGKVEFNHEKGYLDIYHDINLDCGGHTFEEAIINLAALCKEHGYK